MADLEEMIHAAILAPSPDNNQPWLFGIRGGSEILLFHDVSRALPSDVRYMFSLVALGAALENLCIAARNAGWRPVVSYHLTPEAMEGSGADHEPIASIGFEAGGQTDPLYPYLQERRTCRLPYERTPVDSATLTDLENELGEFPRSEIHWVSDRKGIRRLAGLVALCDRIRFEYQPFHEELYRQLRLTPDDAERTGDGLDVRCLEIPKPAIWLLKWLRYWSRMKWLNRLGLSWFLSIPSAVLAWRSGTVGLLTTKASTPEDYLEAGRALQRVWLRAEKAGLGFHPMGSVPIFVSRLLYEDGKDLSVKHQQSIARTREGLDRIYPDAPGKAPVLLFRLGKPTGKTGTRSMRIHGDNVIKKS